MAPVRRKPQNLTPPVSDSSSSGSGHSPPSSSHHHSNNGSPVGSSSSLAGHKSNSSPNGVSGGVKRSNSQDLNELFDEAAKAAEAAKKQRISHYKKPDSSQPVAKQQHESRSAHYHQQQQQHSYGQVAPPTSGRSSSNSNYSSTTSLKARPSPPTHHQQQLLHNHHRSDNHNYLRPGSLPVNSSSSLPMVSTRVTSSTDGPDTPNSSPDSLTTEHMMEVSDHHHYAPVEADASLEYTLQYKPIVSCEQRSRYKEDFNSQYNEYRDLHKAIDKVSKRFAQLEEKLRQQHEGTSAWQVSQLLESFSLINN